MPLPTGLVFRNKERYITIDKDAPNRVLFETELSNSIPINSFANALSWKFKSNSVGEALIRFKIENAVGGVRFSVNNETAIDSMLAQGGLLRYFSFRVDVVSGMNTLYLWSNSEADAILNEVQIDVLEGLSLTELNPPQDKYGRLDIPDPDNDLNPIEPNKTGSGLYLNDTRLGYWYYDEVTPGASGWKSYMNNQGHFYLSGSDSNHGLSWDGEILSIQGSFTAYDGNIGGWIIEDPLIYHGDLYLDATPGAESIYFKTPNGRRSIEIGNIDFADIAGLSKSVTNPSFESGTTGWIIDADTYCITSVSTAQSTDGASSFLVAYRNVLEGDTLANTSSNLGVTTISQVIPMTLIDEDTTFTLAYDAQCVGIVVTPTGTYNKNRIYATISYSIDSGVSFTTIKGGGAVVPAGIGFKRYSVTCGVPDGINNITDIKIELRAIVYGKMEYDWEAPTVSARYGMYFDSVSLVVTNNIVQVNEFGILIYSSPDQYLQATKDGLVIKTDSLDVKSLIVSETLEVYGTTVIYGDVIASSIFPATEFPSLVGVSLLGTSIKYSREDHSHGFPESISIVGDFEAGGIITQNGVPVATNFTDLVDVPSTYVGQAGRIATVNSTEDGIEFSPIAKNNYAGTVAPSVSNDSSQGYSIGSTWIDATSSPKEAYRCLDNSVGAAVWVNTTFTADEVNAIEWDNVLNKPEISGINTGDQVLPIIDDTPYDATTWNSNTDGATKNAIRDKIELIDGDLSNVVIQSINPQTGTTYTFVSTDKNKLVTFGNASPIVVTVPTNASVPFPIGTRIDCAQVLVGSVTFSGVTINSKMGNKTINGQWVVVSLFKTGTDVWLLVGDLVP